MILNSPITKSYIHLRNLYRFLRSLISPEKPLGKTETEIIQSIHTLRFNPKNQYLTTGGHFADLFIRNTGIFYNALLDPRIPSTTEDYQNRYSILQKTISLALNTCIEQGKESTTISPITKKHLVTTDIYTKPSDSVYSILYGLTVLTNPNYIQILYPASTSTTYHTLSIQQKIQSTQLLENNLHSLSNLVTNYLHRVIDPRTNLIKSNITLSSARDGIKRSSSFYDNVIAMATVKLAQNLNLPLPNNLPPLEHWKTTIIQTYWNDAKGIFNDDINHTNFSADQLITIMTGFLDLNSQQDSQKLNRIISYIQQNKLDQPLPLHYADHHDPKQLYWPVRYFAPDYMTKSIWSHWGIEYIKLLILLSKTNPTYFQQAENHLNAYKSNIVTHGGYPECYALDGTPLSQRLYKTVLHTSWVINYEQAKMLLQTQ